MLVAVKNHLIKSVSKLHLASNLLEYFLKFGVASCSLFCWEFGVQSWRSWECHHPFIEDAIPTFPAGTHSTGKQKFLEMFANIDHSLSFQVASHVLQGYFHFIYANSGVFPLGKPALPVSSVWIAFQTIFSRKGNGILFWKLMSALGENTFKLWAPTEAVVCLDK